MSHRTIIEQWPSIEALADDIGANINTARSISARGWIPDWYWWRLVRAAKRRRLAGVSYERLALLSASRRENAT